MKPLPDVAAARTVLRREVLHATEAIPEARREFGRLQVELATMEARLVGANRQQRRTMAKPLREVQRRIEAAARTRARVLDAGRAKADQALELAAITTTEHAAALEALR